MAFDPERDRHSVEALYTSRRLTELRLRPVAGTFDVAHLKEINRRIFQDMPGLGYPDVTPGVFRPPVPKGRDWVKHRRLETAGVASYVAYSPMDEASRAQLSTRLARIAPVKLAALPTDAFVRQLSDLYSDLDYIHPFSDGNSRTLREFTRQLADAAGFELRWETFAKTLSGRDQLYVARDLSVNQRALPHIRHTDTARDLTFSLDQLEGNRNLTELLVGAGRAVILPKRARAFEQMAESQAVAAHPELAPLFGQVRAALDHGQALFPQNPESRDRFVSSVRARIQSALDAGETTVKPVAREPDRAKTPADRDR